MADIASVLGAVGAFATGGSVSLGPMVFTGFEVPSRINFGGTQQLVVHKLPGGGRVIDSLGDDPATPEWKGSFTGPFAAMRARQVNALRLAGEPLPLSFGPFTAQVLIKRFAASYERNGFWIPYSIVCEVLPPAPDTAEIGGTALAGLIGDDAAEALASVASATAQVAEATATPASQASDLLAQLTALPTLTGITLGGITAALTSGASVVAGTANLAQAPGAAQQVAALFQSAVTGTGMALDAVGTGLGAIGNAALAGGNDPVGSVNDMINASALTGAAATLVQARSYAARAAANAASATPSGGGRS